MTKKLLSVLLTLCLVIGAVPLAALADEPVPVSEFTLADEVDSLNNDELFAGYVDRLFYGSLLEDAGISTFADSGHNAGSRLTGNSRKLYDGLKDGIIEIAKGNRASTEITVNGVACSEADIKKVVKALLSDFPYELFWCDKGYSYGSSAYYNYTLVKFRVDKTYSKTKNAGTFETDMQKIKSVQTAVNNATQVVADAKDLSDYEKLVAYKEFICNAVIYNKGAANAGSPSETGFGIDPWQLIYVFDGSPDTNVVCEGYSKAFQYLCDLTTFTNQSIQCYSVSGTIDDGAHMWNIVTIDKKNYLVDVTNCDLDLIDTDGEMIFSGSSNRLFLVGYTSGTAQNGYVITADKYDLPGGYSIPSDSYTYKYDTDQSGLFGSVLNLSNENYDPDSTPDPTNTPNPTNTPDSPSKPTFKDVPAGKYYAAPVAWAVGKGITNGTGKNTFSPEAKIKRRDVVTFLWRAKGEPEPHTTKNPFTDIKEGDYYYKAVLWAVEEKITTGTGKNTFSPAKVCTRKEIATFLWRAKGKPEPHTTKNPFTDIKEDAYYYKAVLWAVENKITKGTGKNTFSPGKDCTRGQTVTFLYRSKDVT